MSHRIVMVTGAAGGIGTHVVKGLAASGAIVIAVDRPGADLGWLVADEAIPAGSIHLHPADLRDEDSIRSLGGLIEQRWGRLDALVANAGVLGELAPVACTDPPMFKDVIATNLTATWQLLRVCDRLLRRSAAGRVVVVSSGAAWLCRPNFAAYSASKAGLEALMRTYANEMAGTETKVVAIRPGPTRTAMRAQAMPGEDPGSTTDPAALVSFFVAATSPGYDRTGLVFDFQRNRYLDWPSAD